MTEEKQTADFLAEVLRSREYVVRETVSTVPHSNSRYLYVYLDQKLEPSLKRKLSSRYLNDSWQRKRCGVLRISDHQSARPSFYPADHIINIHTSKPYKGSTSWYSFYLSLCLFKKFSAVKSNIRQSFKPIL